MGENHYVAYIEQDEDGIYIGSIPSVSNCHAQGETQEELLENLKEVLTLCIRNTETDEIKKTRFIGIQDLELSHA